MKKEEILALRAAAAEGKIGHGIRRKSFVFTGTLSRPRSELKEIVNALGGYNRDDVSTFVHYLVVGDTGRHGKTAKLQRARQLGVTIITESEFAEMMK